MHTNSLTNDVEACVDSAVTEAHPTGDKRPLFSTDGTTEFEGPARFLKDSYVSGDDD